MDSDTGPLNDDEVGKLYALCLHDTKAYNLLRRLVTYGQIQDPPHLDEIPRSKIPTCTHGYTICRPCKFPPSCTDTVA